MCIALPPARRREIRPNFDAAPAAKAEASDKITLVKFTKKK